MSEEPRPRRHRRVQRAGAPGSDPAPKVEPRDDGPSAPRDSDHSPSWGSNDERLRRDVPPHW
ncbi:hypothetical protein [Leifsonia sp. AG29]|uniref:hypothetical protein n=1 Tax=Leifsonia sp. AG29 TaxID=2598860 RepID=UPI00131C665C|nr:hypothetical protein [Leifsonia sp. AG29]